MKYAPGVLWTAAHHRIPLLSVMLNNRGYHQEIMHVQRMCNERNRGVDRGTMGSMLMDPNIDFAKIAQGLGVHGEGPISDPRDLGPALRRAADVVKRGEAAPVDVVIQPRHREEPQRGSNITNAFLLLDRQRAVQGNGVAGTAGRAVRRQ